MYQFFFLEINVDLINSNSGNTMNKNLNCTFNLNTASKNNTMIVNFGDLFQQTYQITTGNSLLPQFINDLILKII